MIKWSWYLKSLKQLLTIWLISCSTFWLSCFASNWYVYQIWTSNTSPFDNSINFSVLQKWSFLSQTLWYWKPIFAWSNWWNKTFLFWKNWLPYFYQDYSNIEVLWKGYGFQCQWFIKSYKVCDSFDENSNSVWNCTVYWIWDWSINVYKNFLSKVKSSDYFFVIEDLYYQRYFEPVLCISSSELWQSLCFVGWTWWESPWCNLTWSLEIPRWIDFTNINSYFYDNSSPAVSNWWTNWNVGWWNWTIISITTTWTITSSCTNWQVLQFYENQGFNTNLCYWWLNSYNTTANSWIVAVPWTWIDVMSMWFDYDSTTDYLTWFNFYRTSYSRWILEQFNYRPYVFQTYFWFINDYWAWKNSDDILEYCDLKLYKWNYNWIFTWLVISESRKQKICSVSSMYFSSNSVDENWNVVNILWNDLLWDWSGLNTYVEWKTFINDTINTIKSQWQIPQKWDFWLWYLPQYIITFLCLIILFRFLQH